MANNPISMAKIRHILRLHSQGRNKLQIAEQTGVSRNTLKKYLKEFIDSGLSFSEINTLSDKDLEDLFVKPHDKPLSGKLQTLFELFPEVDKALKRKGTTQLMLWEAYRQKHADGVGRSQFNYYYHQWKAQHNPTMRIDHKAGDKLYVDFAGEKLSITDITTGEIRAVEVFVAILGASQLTYVEAVMSQQKEDFIGACRSALHFYGGVPAAIVPDNLRAAVSKSSKYEPVINEDYAAFAEHYGTAILPARAYRPRDKALVENAVKIIYTRIYSKIKDKVFLSLEDLNAAIREALAEHNNAHLKGRAYSRQQQFDDVERSALMPLPELDYELKKQASATVMKNGHVSLGCDKHYYSVPYRFIGKKVKILYSHHSVEVYYKYERIALHKRTKSAHHYTTDKDHMASSHRFVSEWTPEKFLSWAQNIHEDVRLYILKVLDRKQHPEQAYKSCVGILSFAKKVGNERLIKACQRALGYGNHSYKTIERILQKGIDQQQDEDGGQLPMPLHDNIRGQNYYQ
ncbi:MAG: transposase [Sorangiineae bacterium NIC37A_2]|nr:MAG: transposase [Sorangiineae bacterium NIC37A_2]